MPVGCVFACGCNGYKYLYNKSQQFQNVLAILSLYNYLINHNQTIIAVSFNIYIYILGITRHNTIIIVKQTKHTFQIDLY